MAQVIIEVNGRPYTVGCEDGQEDHLVALGRVFDEQVRQVGEEVGQLGETRLFLMGALLLADELADTRSRLARVQADIVQLESRAQTVESRAANALDNAARRIETLTAKAAG